ncbi:hypothetical protein C5167_042564 [Papaver somniferum]|uniref:Uncharacterized protein n=1 Tax=Papaver somniferum TaxID=3469 RepID=A0A4Y7L6T5_PAPSO|nr:uncharacterized protein LOC113319409 [Papaver somniferum]RZC79989.1 hypothetical protein C5167_042564 [Papaver somniferum]
MALELLMADNGDIADYGEEEEEEESSLLAEKEQQGNMLEMVVYEENTPLEVPEEDMLEMVVYEENTPLEVPEENMLEMVVYEENTPLEVPEENMLEIVVYEEKSALEEVPEEMTNEIEGRKTISVELAMQRELDYCNKIGEMKKELPGYDFEELSMPVQGEPSNLELWEIDIRTLSDSFSNTQGETSDSVDFEKKIMKDEIRDKTDIAEMANESMKGNIMPVELAIQRELAYQKKIEGMQLQPRYDFVECSMCVQGEPSNLELREIDRRPSSDSFLNTQGETSDPIVSAKKIIKEEIRDATDIAEMANESVKGNIMPVELAIQRELAYQKKIEGIQLQPSYDFVKPPVADKETHSIRIPSEMNVKPRSSRSPCFKDQATTEKVMWKTMSVELALQREIEYQAKIKRLKLEADDDFQEAPQPTTQGTTSGLGLSKMNRESCFENSSSLQGRIPNPIFFRGEVQRERSQHK